MTPRLHLLSSDRCTFSISNRVHTPEDSECFILNNKMIGKGKKNMLMRFENSVVVAILNLSIDF